MTNQRAIILLSQMYLPAFDEEEKQAINKAIEALTAQEKQAINKAIEALTAQEPRVMTLEEVFALQFDDVVYVEMYPALAVISAIVVDSIPWIKDELGVLQIRCIQEPLANMDFAWYGKTWRCWTSRPTKEQREAAPWQ